MTAFDDGAAETPFAGFFLGGFEGSTQRRRDGRQLDIIAASRHDRMARTDYALLRRAGIGAARDALRWHLIETAPGAYDWSSFLPMLRAARETGMQVVWDLCHYGLPPDIDIFAAEFVERFAAFCAAVARVVRDETGGVPVYCPMNEISFWSWAGGDMREIHPHAEGRGWELKCQLVRAALAGLRAVRSVEPRARFVQAEPVINIIGHPDRPEDAEPAEAYRLAQFQSFDMMAGRLAPELGGSEDCLDLVGVNFYFNNQWISFGETMGMGHRLFRPFRDMLVETHDRYRRPMLVAETGAEGGNGPGWLRYVAGEVRAAMRAGVPMQGICIYPVMDYPGWDDERHCPCGVIACDADYAERRLVEEMARQIAEERMLFERDGLIAPETAILRATHMPR
jgi:beta-glucosidase/6-phospho-beta-glucosidase/beta-galactosidase